jgi:hypothetical protein
VDERELFSRFFAPLYPDADASPDALARLRSTDVNPGNNPLVIAHLDDAAARFTANARALFGRDLALDRSDASVHRLSAAMTRDRRDAWAGEGRAGTPENVLFNAVVHGAAYVGACVVGAHAGVWCVRRPLWESFVRLQSRAGEAELAIFSWWLRSLADDAQGTTLADRYRAYVEVPCARPEELPVLSPLPAGPLPRLKSPRYDLLHKYLRAQLPALRDLGEHFPSAERFEAFAFRWLDFLVLGGGRMVLFAGGAPSGLCLFWLSAAGFEKSAFFACDAFPDPLVRVEGEKVVVVVSEGGRQQVHEVLWWGP